MLNVFDYNPATKEINAWPGVGWLTESTQWDNLKRLKVTAGDFRNTGYDEAVVSATQSSGNTGRQVFSYVSIHPTDRTYAMTFPLLTDPGWSWGTGWESDAVAADVNPLRKDGDELVVAGPGEVAVLRFGPDLKPVYRAKTPFLYPGVLEPNERRHFVAVADLDAGTSAASWTPEIVLAEHPQDSLTYLRMFAVNLTSDSITGLTQVTTRKLFSNYRSPKSDILVGVLTGMPSECEVQSSSLCSHSASLSCN